MVNDRIPEDVIKSLYSAIGSFMMSWNFLDSVLDCWISVIYQTAGGKHVEAEIPWTFSQKTKFVRRCLKTIDPLHGFKEEGLEILGTVTRIGKGTRHPLAHGALASYNPDGDIFSFTRTILIDNKKMQKITISEIPGSQILDDASECLRLAPAMTAFAYRLMEAFVPDYEPE
jgi:hypothetical protein